MSVVSGTRQSNRDATDELHEDVSEVSDVVELVVPARNRFVSAARLVAAAVATDVDFTVDDLDDVRIAIDESMTVLIAAASPSESIRITFAASAPDEDGPGRVRIVGAVTSERLTASRPPVDALVTHILTAVTDEYDLAADRFEFVKSAAPGTASTG